MSAGTPGRVFKVVLTGGPCGGKSTALSAISRYLKGVGIPVYSVPEAATILLSGGGEFRGLNQMELIAFQSSIIQTMMSLEDAFVRIAESRGRTAVVLCDRGTMDASAYLPAALWNLLLDENSWTTPALRDARYDAVVHMVTAAEGAAQFYSTESNTTRTETPEQARAIDERLRQVWLGHPHHFIVGNEEAFEDKVLRVVAAICSVVGVPAPAPAAKLRKFALLQGSGETVAELLPAEISREEFEVEHVYLKLQQGDVHDGVGTTGMRLQMRSQQNSRTYTLLSRRTDPATQTTATSERRLTPREYAVLRQQADQSRIVVKKRLTSFLWNGLSLSISQFVQPCNGLSYVEVAPTVQHGKTATTADEQIVLPEWLHASQEVTSDPTYDSWSISQQPAPK